MAVHKKMGLSIRNKTLLVKKRRGFFTGEKSLGIRYNGIV
jgi:hypothetical protein